MRGNGENRSPRVNSHRHVGNPEKYHDCRIDLIGGGSNTDVCPGRQTPSRRHWLTDRDIDVRLTPTDTRTNRTKLIHPILRFAERVGIQQRSSIGSCSVSGPVSTEMGERSWVYILVFHSFIHSFIFTVIKATYTAKMGMQDNKAAYATLTVPLYNWAIKHY